MFLLFNFFFPIKLFQCDDNLVLFFKKIITYYVDGDEGGKQEDSLTYEVFNIYVQWRGHMQVREDLSPPHKKNIFVLIK